MVQKQLYAGWSRLLLGFSILLLAACGGGSSDEGGVVIGPSPAVSSTAAAPAATAVALTVTPMVTFSEAMDGSSLTPSTFTLAVGAVSVGGSVTTQGTIATFRPTAPLLPNTLYTATISSGVKALAGGSLQAAHSWSFTTEALAWAGTAQRGSAATDSGKGVAHDSSGNVYLAGSTLGGLDGNTSTGGEDLCLFKFNSAGVRQWTAQFGSSASDAANAVAVDSSGNVYVAGVTLGSLPMANSGNSGGSDLFLIKYNTAGIQQWVRQLGSVGADQAKGVAVDAAGNIYVTGSTLGTLPGVGNVNAGGEDLFLLKYDGAGVLQWVRQFGSVAGDQAYGVTVGSNGEIFVAGATLGALPGNASAGGSDYFLASYTAAGARQWIHQFGSVGFDAAHGVAADTQGGIYLGGVTSGLLAGSVNAGGSDLFVAKYDTLGTRLWTRQLGSVGADTVLGVGAEARGGVFLTGSSSGGLDGNLSSGGEDLVLLKYDSLGNKQWTRQLGTVGTEQGRAVAVDSGGNAFVGGGTTGALSGLVNAGGEDLLLVKYDTTGTRQ